VLLLRALRAVYTALGGFSSATLVALLGVVFASRLPLPVRSLIELLAVLAGAVGVGGIVWAAVLLLRETRIAVGALELRFSTQEARFTAHRTR
jgi:membrane protein DedA with SNARE-associated domain